MTQEVDGGPRFDLKLDPGRALPESIAEAIRSLIDAGEFKAGTKLPNESELARRMKVARSSVRTALQRLETQGLLQVRRGLGWYVRRVPQAGDAERMPGLRDYRVSDLFELRIGLEGLAASLAAIRATDAQIENIAKLNTQHEEAVGQEESLATDLDFHQAIVEAGRNELLLATYGQIIGELNEWRYDSYATPGVLRRSARDHGKVVRYLRNHDAGGARVAMTLHLQPLYDSLPEISEEPMEGPEMVIGAEPDWQTRGMPH